MNNKKTVLKNRNLFIIIVSITAFIIFIVAVIWGISPSIFIPGSRIPSDKAIEEYLTIIEPLNIQKTNFRVIERIRFNTSFLEEIYKFRRCIVPYESAKEQSDVLTWHKDEFFRWNWYKFECFRGFYKFGIIELINMGTGEKLEWDDNGGYFFLVDLDKAEFNKLQEIQKTAMEMPSILDIYDFRHINEYQYYQNEVQSINAQTTDNPLYKKISLSPLNRDREGYFYLIDKKLKLLFKTKLCTHKCPYSEIKTVNLPEEIKVDFQKKINKSQEKVTTRSSGDFLDRGINITYVEPHYSYFYRIITRLYELIAQNFGLLIPATIGVFILSRKKFRKYLFINQSHSNIGVGYSEENTVTQQAGTILNGQELIQQELSQDIDFTAEQIRRIIKQLQETHPIATPNQKEDLALEAIKLIEKDAFLKEQVVKVDRTIGVKALEDRINHPVAINFCDLMVYYKII